MNIAPPTTEADAASVKNGTVHVTRYLRQRWRPEWLRAGLSPTNVLGTFSHLMAVRKLQELERRGKVPEYAGQINRPALRCASRRAGLVAGSRRRCSGAQFHYKTCDLAIMASVFDSELWLFIKEKLRCKGVDVSGMQPPRAVGGADPQQSRLERFFAGPQGE